MGQSIAMGGTAYGLRNHNAINPMNPATYSAIDSLTFLFDFAMTGTLFTLQEQHKKEHNAGYNIEYIAMKIPLAKGLGFSMGMYEYSKLGYAFTETKNVPIAQQLTYSASGGINNFYAGLSMTFFKNLSLGANMNYRFGNLHYKSSASYPGNSSAKSTSIIDDIHLNQFVFDFGMQYQQQIDKKNSIVVGAVYSMPNMFNSECIHTTITLDTLSSSAEYDFGTPASIGVGLSYVFDNRFTLAFDYQQQAWDRAAYFGKLDTLGTAKRLSLGMEYLPQKMGDHYYQVIKYRAGLRYSESYLKFAGENLKNIGFTLGMGLPFKNQKSLLNLAFEYGKTITPSQTYIQERYAKISLSITFNEYWFMKRKFN